MIDYFYAVFLLGRPSGCFLVKLEERPARPPGYGLFTEFIRIFEVIETHLRHWESECINFEERPARPPG